VGLGFFCGIRPLSIGRVLGDGDSFFGVVFDTVLSGVSPLEFL
jgi:hypothetical protein